MATSTKKLDKRRAVTGSAPTAAAVPTNDTAAPTITERAERVRDFILKVAVIVLVSLWIYSPSYHGDWLWDDDQAIMANATIQNPNSLPTIWLKPDGADYFPLTTTATWLQWQFFGADTTGYHIVNICFHILGALLLWALIREMKLPGAWLAGLIFAVHPVCVESVAWMSELKNTLSLPFFLLACIYFIRFEEAEKRSDGWWNYAASLICFLLSMLAKTSVVMLPVILLLYAWWKRSRITMQDIVRTAPFFLISLVLGLVTIHFQHGRAIGAETIPVGGMLSRTATAGMAILFYLWKTLWPVQLLPIYPRWEVDPPKLIQFLPWPILFAAVAWMWANRKTWGKHLLFSFGFFVISLLPVLGFITISYMRITWVADHFVYLPMISVVGLFCVAAARWFERAKPMLQPLALGGTTVLVTLLSYSSFLYAHAWANEDALWTHTLKYNPNAWQAHNRLGAKKAGRGDVEGAFYHFTHSTRLRPDLAETHNNLGTAFMAKGRMEDAIREFREACRVNTGNVPTIRLNLANALGGAGRFAEAKVEYEALVAQEPNNPVLLTNYGVTLLQLGEREKAIEQFKKAIAIAPNMKEPQNALAVATGQAQPQPVPQPQQPQPQPNGGMLPSLDSYQLPSAQSLFQ